MRLIPFSYVYYAFENPFWEVTCPFLYWAIFFSMICEKLFLHSGYESFIGYSPYKYLHPSYKLPFLSMESFDEQWFLSIFSSIISAFCVLFSKPFHKGVLLCFLPEAFSFQISHLAV